MAKGQIEAIISGIGVTVEKVMQKITLDIVANLKETTPVDTGWARANWIPMMSNSFDGTVGSPEDLAPHKGKGTFPQAVQEQRLAAILGYNLKDGRIFISNNVPYIKRLNDGSSKKAPSGFVIQAIEKAVTQDINPNTVNVTVRT